MKLDHFVINVDTKYQQDEAIINNIRSKGFPYEPKWGKGTKGFKASNLWIGNEYFEMIKILKSDGGGWIPEWTYKYNKGHRGLICLMLDVDDIDAIYNNLNNKKINVSKPQWLEFKCFLNLLTRRMPWRNCYAPFFEGVDLQIGFQQMKDDKARNFMNQYMVPNSKDTGINGIHKVIIKANFTNNDFEMIKIIFDNLYTINNDSITITFNNKQIIEFIKNNQYEVIIHTDSDNSEAIEIENIKLF